MEKLHCFFAEGYQCIAGCPFGSKLRFLLLAELVGIQTHCLSLTRNIMLSRLFANTIYVKVFKNRFALRHIESGFATTVISSREFTTTRLLVGQFEEADEALREGVKEISGRRLLAVSPVIVIQPMEKTENGLSQVEERVLHELAASAGARKTIVWVGHELTDQEVLSKSG